MAHAVPKAFSSAPSQGSGAWSHTTSALLRSPDLGDSSSWAPAQAQDGEGQEPKNPTGGTQPRQAGERSAQRSKGGACTWWAGLGAWAAGAES